MIELTLFGIEMFPFESQFQLEVVLITVGCGSTLTATFVRVALDQDWKCGGKGAPRITAARSMPNKAKAKLFLAFAR
jgi:hypothetical protein